MARPRAAADPTAELAADRARVLADNRVPAAVAERLDRFVALLLTWQRTINLIAPSTIGSLWSRHVADSLQLLPLAPQARVFVDLGSGGGFPGLVIACALAETPGAAVHLIESNGKKAAFLREAARALGLPAQVHARRIEDVITGLASQRVDVVTARALAPLAELVAYAAPLLITGSKALFLKGQDVDAELTAASKYWNIDLDLVPSRTDPKGRVVVIRRAERRIPVD